MMVDIRKLRELTSTPEELLHYLDGMSNSAFRSASRVLGERLLVETDTESFWHIFRSMFIKNRKAYLGTLLKALIRRISLVEGRTSDVFAEVGLWNNVSKTICSELTDTDRIKILFALLPLASNPQEAERLFFQCGLKEPSQWISYLLQVQTNPSAFLLLKSLRYVEHDKPLLIRTCHFMMKKGDERSFNIASLIRLSFGLEEVRGTFSLTLEPYQLARVEQNYDAFLQVLDF